MSAKLKGPKPQHYQGYERILCKLQETFDKQVSDLAERIRTEVIVPMCQKHQLTFLSGMGRFFFSRDKENYSDEYDTPDELKFDLVPILNLLDQEVSHNQYLGYYVSDVKKEDICPPRKKP
jgi:hypothetical protein